MAFLAIALKKRSVRQKMDENQTAFSVRTEIRFCEIRNVRNDGDRKREEGTSVSTFSCFFLAFSLVKKEEKRNNACICVSICNYLCFMLHRRDATLKLP